MKAEYSAVIMEPVWCVYCQRRNPALVSAAMKRSDSTIHWRRGCAAVVNTLYLHFSRNVTSFIMKCTA